MSGGGGGGGSSATPTVSGGGGGGTSASGAAATSRGAGYMRAGLPGVSGDGPLGWATGLGVLLIVMARWAGL